mmetsp:Transcript_24238/g.54504  ORF Transcript_24238/g.54504 Transcript_24238/m.54504 type:complete len:236 (-) Transcript_24238:781-1488(-)
MQRFQNLLMILQPTQSSTVVMRDAFILHCTSFSPVDQHKSNHAEVDDHNASCKLRAGHACERELCSPRRLLLEHVEACGDHVVGQLSSDRHGEIVLDNEHAKDSRTSIEDDGKRLLGCTHAHVHEVLCSLLVEDGDLIHLGQPLRVLSREHRLLSTEQLELRDRSMMQFESTELRVSDWHVLQVERCDTDDWPLPLSHVKLDHEGSEEHISNQEPLHACWTWLDASLVGSCQEPG